MSKRELQMLGISPEQASKQLVIDHTDAKDETSDSNKECSPINTPDETMDNDRPSPDLKSSVSRQSHALPYLLREKDVSETEFRAKFPRSSHVRFDSYGKPDSQMKDPYSGVVVWAKIQGHPYWPARLATKEENLKRWKDRSPEPNPKQSLRDGEASDNLHLYFLGSHDVGCVKRSMTEPFLSRYKEFSPKLSSRAFLLALEEADAEAIRAEFTESPGMCMACGGVEDDVPILLCDRCNSEAHTDCVGLTKVPEDDWLCPVCLREAPLTAEDLTKGDYDNRLRDRISEEDKEEDDEAEEAEEGGGEEVEGKETTKGQKTTSEKKPDWSPEEDSMMLKTLLETAGNFDVVISNIPTRTIGAMRSRLKLLQTKGAPSLDRLRRKNGPAVTVQEVEAFMAKRIGDYTPVKRSSSTNASLSATASAGDDSKMSSAFAVPVSDSGKDAKKKEGEDLPKKKMKSFIGTSDAAKKQSSVSKPKPILPSANDEMPTYQQSQKDFMKGKLETLKSSRMTKESSSATIFSSPQLTRHAPPPSQKPVTYCFVCGEDGAEVSCGDTVCDRYFHAFCLGASAPPVTKGKKGGEWYCPWHFCAVCQSQSAALASNKPILFPISNQYKIPSISEVLGTVRWRSESLPPEALLAVHGIVKVASDEDVESGAKSASKSLHRCCACPLALCTMHLYTACEFIVRNKDTGLPDEMRVGVERKENNFFACERCAGMPKLIRPAPPQATTSSTRPNPSPPPGGPPTRSSQNNTIVSSSTTSSASVPAVSYAPVSATTPPLIIIKSMQHLPRMVLARELDGLLAEVVYVHSRILRFALNTPSTKMVERLGGPEAVQVFFQMGAKNARPLSLRELQAKTRLLAYQNIMEFEDDVLFLAEALALLYKSKQPKLMEAARTIPLLIREIAHFRSKNIIVAQQKAAEDEQTFFDYLKAFPGVRATHEKEALRGLCPWEVYVRSYETDVGELDDLLKFFADLVHDEHAVNGFGPQNGLGALIEAAYGAHDVPLIDENGDDDTEKILANMATANQVQTALDEHMDRLRAALMSGAVLRTQFKKLLNVWGSVDEANEAFYRPMLTVGGGDIEAERAAASKSLKAKLTQAESQLEMERLARIQLEKRLEELETRLDGKRSSAAIFSIGTASPQPSNATGESDKKKTLISSSSSDLGNAVDTNGGSVLQ